MADPIPNRGATPVAFDTPVGEVRLLIGDTNVKPGTEDATEGVGQYTFFSDEEITALIGSWGSPRAAASGALRAIAASTVLKLKKWTSADLAVDGPSIANTLLRAADAIDSGTAAAAGAESAEFAKRVPVGGYSREALAAELDGAGWPFGII